MGASFDGESEGGAIWVGKFLESHGVKEFEDVFWEMGSRVRDDESVPCGDSSRGRSVE